MFKRRVAGQGGFPSEPAAPLLPGPVPEGPAAPSPAAELAYLDSDVAPHEGEQPLMISASRLNPLAVPSFAKRAFSFVGYPSSVDLSHMNLVEEMDRTLKAWVQMTATSTAIRPCFRHA